MTDADDDGCNTVAIVWRSAKKWLNASLCQGIDTDSVLVAVDLPIPPTVIKIAKKPAMCVTMCWAALFYTT